MLSASDGASARSWSPAGRSALVPPVICGQLTAVLTREFGLRPGDRGFDDVPPTPVSVDDIARLAASAITRGCDPPDSRDFCPAGIVVNRRERAAFVNRAHQAGS